MDMRDKEVLKQFKYDYEPYHNLCIRLKRKYELRLRYCWNPEAVKSPR